MPSRPAHADRCSGLRRLRFRTMAMGSVGLFLIVTAQAAPPQTSKVSVDAASVSVDAASVTAKARETSALEFARKHHKELADLLSHLKSSNRGAYDKGIQHLHRDSERLARTKANNPARYDLELELWKTESRIRLTAARTMMDDSPDTLKAELRDLIAHREDVKLQQWRASRERLTSQLAKVETDIAAAEASRDERIAAELEKLLKAPPRKRDVKTVNAAKVIPEKPAKTPEKPKPQKNAPAPEKP